MINYYATLGILPAASSDEIKSSYRQLVKRFHPDMGGGNPRVFSLVQEAYGVLSDPERRRVFDARWHSLHTKQQTHKAQQPTVQLTRIMSIAMPRSGVFQLSGVVGRIYVRTTTVETLWRTTRKKFSNNTPEKIARHAVQIKLSGERDLVQHFLPRTTEYGVHFDRADDGKDGPRQTPPNTFQGMYGANLPMSLLITVPVGVDVCLRDITGSIHLAEMEGRVTAKLMGGVMRAGRIRGLHLTLNGGSRAVCSDVDGPCDVLGYGAGKALLNGKITRLRVALDNNAHLDVRATVNELMAEANGQSLIDMRGMVNEAYCDARESSVIRLAKVRDKMQGRRSGRAYIEAPAPLRSKPPLLRRKMA